MKIEYFYILIILIIKICRQYFKKKLDDSIDVKNLIFYNSVFVIILFLLYNMVLDSLGIKNFSPFKLLDDYVNLDNKNKFIIFILGAFSLISTLSFFKLDESDDQSKIPIIIKSLSTILTIVIGCYFNGEEITKKHIFGIILILIGLYLMTNKKNVD